MWNGYNVWNVRNDDSVFLTCFGLGTWIPEQHSDLYVKYSTKQAFDHTNVNINALEFLRHISLGGLFLFLFLSSSDSNSIDKSVIVIKFISMLF